MHSERDGKLIIEVKFSKKSIKVKFDDDTEIKISESTYAHYYLYKDKLLTEVEINDILKYESLTKGKAYAISLLSNGLYSEKEIRDKLKLKKKIPSKDINIIINELKDLHLIDDEGFIEEYLELFESKNYGKLRIINELKKAGIKESLISRIEFNDDNELDKANNEILKFIKTNPNKNYQKLCQSGYAHLLLYGFSNEIATKAIDIISEKHDFETDLRLLDKEIDKVIRKPNIDLNSYEIKQKVVSSLLRKGFLYEDIINRLRRVTKDEIC